jgi:hypothetical protein
MSRYPGWHDEAVVQRLIGQKLTQEPQEVRTGSRRVGGRYVQRGTAGKRDALGGLFVRSRYECNLACWLHWQGIDFDYEPVRFEFPGIRGRNSFCIPDFHLIIEDRWLECKGYFDNDSRIRLKRMQKFYPHIRIELIRSHFFREICRQRVCKLIVGWECRHTGYGG